MWQLMDEVEHLVRELLQADAAARPLEHVAYDAAFEREFGTKPGSASREDLLRLASGAGLALHDPGSLARDDLLDLLVGAVVGPRLGRGRLTFLHHYPASQAALARLDPEAPGTALRFELYADGVELANGFDELASAPEQRARFESDLAERRRRGLAEGPVDERLLGALAAGLPPCSGVAVGFDRVLMLATGAAHIRDVLPFTTGNA
jgi:lysyl-tRNA synthetase class 2